VGVLFHTACYLLWLQACESSGLSLGVFNCYLLSDCGCGGFNINLPGSMVEGIGLSDQCVILHGLLFAVTVGLRDKRACFGRVQLLFALILILDVAG